MTETRHIGLIWIVCMVVACCLDRNRIMLRAVRTRALLYGFEGPPHVADQVLRVCRWRARKLHKGYYCPYTKPAHFRDMPLPCKLAVWSPRALLTTRSLVWHMAHLQDSVIHLNENTFAKMAQIDDVQGTQSECMFEAWALTRSGTITLPEYLGQCPRSN